MIVLPGISIFVRGRISLTRSAIAGSALKSISIHNPILRTMKPVSSNHRANVPLLTFVAL